MDTERELHPAEEALLRFFDAPTTYAVSMPFSELAAHIINSAPPGPETTMALRKLLEAKDCAVRAGLDSSS